MDGWMKKIDKDNTNGILISHKNNAISLFVVTWMNLVVIMLNKISRKTHIIIWFHSYVAT